MKGIVCNDPLCNMENISQLVKYDLENIYLGNLKTVEFDLALPSKGKNGSVFVWESSNENIITKSGKVYRPREGLGNREVVLKATASIDHIKLERSFPANVLQVNSLAEIEYAIPFHASVAVGGTLILPQYVAAKTNKGYHISAKVKWEDFDTALLNDKGSFKVQGVLIDTDIKVIAEIAVCDAQQKKSENVTKKLEHCGYATTSLKQGSIFYDACQRSLEYILALNPDDMLYNFYQLAGINDCACQPISGWDSPESKLKGHTTGHYLSALSLAFASTNNSLIKKTLDYVIERLDLCQQKIEKRDDCNKGFLSAYNEEQFDLLEVFTKYPEIWAPYYTLHKIMAGLRDCYVYGKNQKALEICSNLGIWVYNRLSKLTNEHRIKMWEMYIAGEYGGMNEVLTDLYLLTNNELFLTTASFFDNDKLYVPLMQNTDALGGMHANQHIPPIVGAIKQYTASGNEKYKDIAQRFWDFVTDDHIYNLGGVGNIEMFEHAGEIASKITNKTAESCASYNMLKLTALLFEHKSDSKYMDYYEKAMYNHIISSGDGQNPSGGSTYFMPLNPGAQKSFDTSENSCCHGTGMENHFKYQENIYAINDKEVYINLHVPSQLNDDANGVKIDIDVEENNSINVMIKGVLAQKKTLFVRKPAWVSLEDMCIKTKLSYRLENGYLLFEEVEGNFEIDIDFSIKLRLELASDNLKYASVYAGPYLLVAINEEDEYLEFEHKDFETKFVRKNTFVYELNGVLFKPLSMVQNERYHAYIVINS